MMISGPGTTHATPLEVAEEKPPVTLSGGDGNANSMIALCTRAARRNGWSRERIEAFAAEARAGNYDHVVQTCQKHFDVS